MRINGMTTVEQGSMKRVCQNEGDPAEDWEEFKMGEFLNQTCVALLASPVVNYDRIV